ncbi:MAG: hypothetical protein JXR22_04585 [Prolixibacteraceae bacterium]|nr:hypothetical protein [Prolixibacteraceae bacterium]
MAQLNIKRQSSWMHRKQIVQLLCNNQVLAEIANGEQKHSDLAAGQHVLQASMSLYRSRKLTVNLHEGESLKVVIAVPRWLQISDIVAAAIVAIYFTLKIFGNMEGLGILPPIVLSLAAVYLIMNFTVVRKHYFTLKVGA